MEEKTVLSIIRLFALVVFACFFPTMLTASYDNRGVVALFLNDPAYEAKLSPIERSLAEQGIRYRIFKIFNDELPENEKEYAGVIIAGGDSMRNYIDWNDNVYQGGEIILRGEVPILGICLGHQIISRVFGSVLYYSDERRWHEMTLLKDDKILEGFDNGLLVWENHAYAVASIPDQFELFARGNVTPIQMMKHKEKEIYGVQFHPETQGGFLRNPPGWQLIKNFAKIAGVSVVDPPLPEDGRKVFPY
ncbi:MULTISPECIES: type 1 glutamine amidotransferase [unclassified Mesotoga]|uniref:type 1 glutamine amidotransferase n=1 Tax=unclassified Mesotoga TaxID=1184398 RepID=UPI000EF1F6BE|nr:MULTISPECIES: gamma-glutamyl-gamma-aminobutyrate hydrolase family protein [unclassified Mesotoga]MDD3681129.1 gamma-glutamyl-gamma-aminobutyrate hydrolase family protein [Mesotoga sp.]MDD5683136.1 gamma-glutamyl-gamma-aminobutyrate hydrolase family protein [Mesotoga sp.]NLT44145.1 C26 family cysteine hydrolase domain-containing family [Thermotogaceae bacterium]RLL86433.1 glutamine amidotransferase [Mesotoga sp. BH458_6_3_2_1]